MVSLKRTEKWSDLARALFKNAMGATGPRAEMSAALDARERAALDAGEGVLLAARRTGHDILSGLAWPREVRGGGR